MVICQDTQVKVSEVHHRRTAVYAVQAGGHLQGQVFVGQGALSDSTPGMGDTTAMLFTPVIPRPIIW